MADLNDPNFQRELAARLQYYREMGIYDFYRRESAGGAGDGQKAVATQESGASAVLPVLNAKADVAAELRAIREDIGDCTRCALHKGRNNIVYGVRKPHG